MTTLTPAEFFVALIAAAIVFVIVFSIVAETILKLAGIICGPGPTKPKLPPPPKLAPEKPTGGPRGDFSIKKIVEETGTPITDFTCYDCPLASNCRYAFDLYNTDGDCLAEK